MARQPWPIVPFCYPTALCLLSRLEENSIQFLGKMLSHGLGTVSSVPSPCTVIKISGTWLNP